MSRPTWRAWERDMEPRVRRLARTYARPGCDREDLEQEGRLAAWRAWQRYDDTRGAGHAYALRAIEGAMRQYVRDRWPMVHVPAYAWEAGTRTQTQLSGDCEDTPWAPASASDSVERAAMRGWLLSRVRGALPARQWRILCWTVLAGQSTDRVAERLGLAPSTTRYYQERALTRLQDGWQEIAGESVERKPDALTRRQREVLRLLATGLTSRQIGERLGVGKRCMDEHLRLVYRRLGVHGAVAAVVEGMRRGIVPLPAVRPPDEMQ